MNFQSKVFESAALFAKRAAALANSTASQVRDRAAQAAKKVDLQDALTQLTSAGGELRKIASQHGGRFVKENAAIAKAAGKDLGQLTRSVYSKFADRTAKPAPRARKKNVARKRTARKAA